MSVKKKSYYYLNTGETVKSEEEEKTHKYFLNDEYLYNINTSNENSVLFSKKERIMLFGESESPTSTLFGPSSEDQISDLEHDQTLNPNQNNLGYQVSNPNQTNLGYQVSNPNQTNLGYQVSNPNQNNLGYQTSNPNQTNLGYQVSNPNQTNLEYQVSNPNQNNLGDQTTTPIKKSSGYLTTPSINTPTLSYTTDFKNESANAIGYRPKEDEKGYQLSLKNELAHELKPNIDKMGYNIQFENVPAQILSNDPKYSYTPHFVKETNDKSEIANFSYTTTLTNTSSYSESNIMYISATNSTKDESSKSKKKVPEISIKTILENEHQCLDLIQFLYKDSGPSNFVRYLLSQHLFDSEIEEFIQKLKSKQIDQQDNYKDSLDWNKKFQQKITAIINGNEKDSSELIGLTQDFKRITEMYGKVIITEKNLPVLDKTIKPVDVGGVAGGSKYIVAGILYKFAQDTEIGSGQWLYGMDSCSEERAIKAAGHELKGLEGVFGLRDGRLRVPLMNLIDYRGYRLTAVCLLPIGGDNTLVYGSRNGGRTILDGQGHPAVRNGLLKLSEKLHLQPHLVPKAIGQHQFSTIFTGADVEIHRSKEPSDNLYYCLDFARLFPPLYSEKNEPPSNIFVFLFRAEFLKSYSKYLSSDAMSGFGTMDPNFKSHCHEIAVATQYLKDAYIKEKVDTLTEKIENPSQFAHHWGINLRYLGKIRCHILQKNPKTEEDVFNLQALLEEMVCRVIHKLLQGKMRNLQVGTNEDRLKFEVAHILNLLIEPEHKIWKAEKGWLKARLVDKYGLDSFDSRELQSDYDLSQELSISKFFHKLTQVTEIKLGREVRDQLKQIHSKQHSEKNKPEISRIHTIHEHTHKDQENENHNHNHSHDDDDHHHHEELDCSGFPALDDFKFSRADINLVAKVKEMSLIRKLAQNISIKRTIETKSLQTQLNIFTEMYRKSFKAASQLKTNAEAQTNWASFLSRTFETKRGLIETAMSPAEKIDAIDQSKCGLGDALNHFFSLPKNLLEKEFPIIAEQVLHSVAQLPEVIEDVKLMQDLLPFLKNANPVDQKRIISSWLRRDRLHLKPWIALLEEARPQFPDLANYLYDYLLAHPRFVWHRTRNFKLFANSLFPMKYLVETCLEDPTARMITVVKQKMPNIQRLSLFGSAQSDLSTGLIDVSPVLEELFLMDSLAPLSISAFQPDKWKKLKRLVITNGIVGADQIQNLQNLKSIEHFSLIHCPALTSELLYEKILPNWPNLETLSLEECNQLGPEIFTKGISKYNKNVNSLSIPSLPYAITDESLNVMVSLTDLRHLNLYNCGITNAAIKTLIPLFAVLYSLNLGSNRLITDDAFTTLSKFKNPGLKELNLSQNISITSKAIAVIAKVFPHLEDLDLSACKLDTETCSIIGKKFSSSLRSLNLSKNPDIDNDGLAGLAGCKNIQQLFLDELPISKFTSHEFEQWDSLSTVSLKKCSKLEDAGIKALTEKCRNLSVIELAKAEKITSRAIEFLSIQCPYLTFIHLGTVSTKGIEALSVSSPHLIDLRMKLTTSEKLNTLFSRAYNLSRLNLHGSTTRDWKFLSECKFLNHLDLSDSTLDNDALLFLKDNCQQIRKLKLDGCINISDGLPSVLSSCVSLNSISLKNITVSQGCLSALNGKPLVEINLSGWMGTDTGALKTLIQGVAGTLQLFKFSNPNKKLDAVEPIETLLCCKFLTRLNIQGVQDLPPFLIQKLLTQLSLIQLNVSETAITDQCLEAVPLLSKTPPRFSDLRFNDCKDISIEGLKTLKGLKTLSHLEINGIQKVSIRELSELLKTLPSLSVLTVFQCGEIKDQKTAEILRNQYPNVKISFLPNVK